MYNVLVQHSNVTKNALQYSAAQNNLEYCTPLHSVQYMCKYCSVAIICADSAFRLFSLFGNGVFPFTSNHSIPSQTYYTVCVYICVFAMSERVSGAVPV